MQSCVALHCLRPAPDSPMPTNQEIVLAALAVADWYLYPPQGDCVTAAESSSLSFAAAYADVCLDHVRLSYEDGEIKTYTYAEVMDLGAGKYCHPAASIMRDALVAHGSL